MTAPPGDATAIVSPLAAAQGGAIDGLPITRLHLLVLAICTIGFGFDQAEIAIGSALSAVFSSGPNAADATALAWLLASVYIGAIVGASTLGWLADRLGRRIVLPAILLFLALTSLLAALSVGMGWMSLARGLSGIAIGAFPPVMIAYLTDIMPARRRGMLIFLVTAVASLAQAGIIFLIRWLTPLQPLGIEAWRWSFLLGSAGAAVSCGLFLLLPESPRWLAAHGRLAEVAAVEHRFNRSPRLFGVVAPRSKPAAPPRVAGTRRTASFRHRIGLMIAMFFLSPWSTVAFPLLTGAVLIEKGFKLSDSLLYVGVTMFGPFLGTVIASLFVDRIERRVALAGSAVLMLVFGVGFVVSLSPLWLMVSGTAFSVFAAIYIPVLSIYAAELFSTGDRGTATAGAWAVNRLGAVIAPLALVPLLHSGGSIAMFAIIAVALLASALLVLLAGPDGRSGAPVD